LTRKQLSTAAMSRERRVRARGIVVWDDKHGKTGVSFQCADSRDQRELNLWLDAQFRGSAPHASL
jgi:hypothetical protein